MEIPNVSISNMTDYLSHLIFPGALKFCLTCVDIRKTETELKQLGTFHFPPSIYVLERISEMMVIRDKRTNTSFVHAHQ